MVIIRRGGSMIFQLKVGDQGAECCFAQQSIIIRGVWGHTPLEKISLLPKEVEGGKRLSWPPSSALHAVLHIYLVGGGHGRSEEAGRREPLHS